MWFPLLNSYVLQVIALIFQDIKSLILDLPARPAATHDYIYVVRRQLEVGDPTEVLELSGLFDPLDDFRGRELPVFQHVDQVVGVRLVERHAVVAAEVVQHARVRL